MKKLICIVAALAIVMIAMTVWCKKTYGAAQLTPVSSLTVDERLELFLDVLWEKEGSKKLRPTDGDDGKAKGPLQIWAVYWIDATKHAGVYGKSSWRYSKAVYDINRSRQVVLWYMDKYVPDALEKADLQVLFRTHNGGPAGAASSKTLGYWADVKVRLARRGYSCR